MQRIIPHIFLTLLLGILANSKVPFIKNILIKSFINIYRPNLEEAKYSEISHYQSYNDFFVRKLRDDAREVDWSDNVVISPVDGEIVDYGKIKDGQLIQAKKHKYSIIDLVGEDDSRFFDEGFFITIYLAPTDYHRIHCPFDGEIINTKHLGTSLFSVNKSAQSSIPKLYIKNERSVLNLNSENFKYSLVSVGASVVGSIVPFWANEGLDSRKSLIESWNKGPEKNCMVKKGDEIAHFRMGSTVILIFENCNDIDLDSLKENKRVKFGEKLVSLKNR